MIAGQAQRTVTKLAFLFLVVFVYVRPYVYVTERYDLYGLLRIPHWVIFGLPLINEALTMSIDVQVYLWWRQSISLSFCHLG